MAGIRLDRIEKTYPNGHVAVRALDLDVADGEFMVLVGPSGCGKSTTLRMIAGLESATGGHLFIGDRDVTAVPPQDRDLAMVFQSYALYPHMTVRENMAFGLKMRKTPADVIAERVAKVAEVLGLGSMMERKPGQLSGGQRQRVALGRAMVREPKAFLLDEPLSNLDAKLRVQTRAELARMHRQLGATMVYVTHDQEEAMTLGDRITVLHDGRLQQCAAPLEIYRRPANVFVAGFIGSPAMNFFLCMPRLDGEHLRLESPAFQIPLDAPLKQKPSAPQVLLGVRPHDLKLVDAGDAIATARVDVIQPLGVDMVVHLELPGKDAPISATLVAPAATQLRVDDRVGLRFDLDHVHLFDGPDGVRLN